MKIFREGDYDINYFITGAKLHTLGLPDLQREYVWTASQVRNLLDSMYNGFPIGSFMLWESQSVNDNKIRDIGSNKNESNSKNEVVIDGQQRITSLFAVMTGAEIKDFKKSKIIKIAFNPFIEEFKVANITTDNDPEWISNVTDIFLNEEKSMIFINNYIDENNKYREKKNRETLNEDEKQKVYNSISNVLALKKYPIHVQTILGTIDEEKVADVFVRVNAGGSRLNENDFILTLMSVVSPELRDKIEDFCRGTSIISMERTSYNHLIDLEPQHLVRIGSAVGLKRGRLKYAYKVLRGVNLSKRTDNTIHQELREESFNKFEEGINNAINLDNWEEFIKIVNCAGFVNKNMILAENTFIFCYVMYLIGKYNFKMDYTPLRNLIAKWFYFTSTTSYYSERTESKVESDLNDINELHNNEEFVNYIDNKIKSIMTDDYFEITLPTLLNTSGNPPVWNTYLAALNILDQKVLFSDLLYSKLFSPEFKGNRSALEKHHLFPKKYLPKVGYVKVTDINQVANYAYIEWKDNNDISDDAPSIYFPDLFKEKTKGKSEEEISNILKYNALPKDWYNMEYKEFLEKRRSMMANIIKEGFEKLMKR